MQEKIHKHGLMVARFQPLHYGHIRIVNYMLAYCEQVTIIIGSIQESKTIKNPLSYEQRKELISNYFKAEVESEIIKIAGQKDISDDDNWLNVILETTKDIYKDNYKKVDAYFSGSESDARWYEKIENVIILDRTAKGFQDISATKVRKFYCENNKEYLNYIPKETIHYLKDIVCKK